MSFLICSFYGAEPLWSGGVPGSVAITFQEAGKPPLHNGNHSSKGSISYSKISSGASGV